MRDIERESGIRIRVLEVAVGFFASALGFILLTYGLLRMKGGVTRTVLNLVRRRASDQPKEKGDV